MAWTDPRTWVASEYVTATLMNTHLRDNLDYLYDAMRGAWMDVTDTMTYSSATTITIAGDPVAYNRYTKGTRLKLTQTTAKYFVVVNSDAVGSDSVITITGGSDYTLANAAIASPYYSYGNPPDYPTWFNWTPTPTGFSSVPTGTVYRFSVTGNTCMAFIRQGNGTSNDTVFTIPAPITAKTLTNAQWETMCRVTDAGSIQASPGYMYIASAQTSITVHKTLQDGAWTNTGNKRVVSALLVYEI